MKANLTILLLILTLSSCTKECSKEIEDLTLSILNISQEIVPVGTPLTIVASILADITNECDGPFELMNPIKVEVVVMWSDDPNTGYEPVFILDENGNEVVPFFEFKNIKNGENAFNLELDLAVPGYYQVSGCVDPDNQINERDESNNCG